MGYSIDLKSAFKADKPIPQGLQDSINALFNECGDGNMKKRLPKGVRAAPSSWSPWQVKMEEWNGRNYLLEGVDHLEDYNHNGEYVEWLIFILKHYLVPNGYKMCGEVRAVGSDLNDQTLLILEDNVLSLKEYRGPELAECEGDEWDMAEESDFLPVSSDVVTEYNDWLAARSEPGSRKPTAGKRKSAKTACEKDERAELAEKDTLAPEELLKLVSLSGIKVDEKAKDIILNPMKHAKERRKKKCGKNQATANVGTVADIDFCSWRKWSDDDWTRHECAIDEALDDEMDCAKEEFWNMDMESDKGSQRMGQYDFLLEAYRRNKIWTKMGVDGFEFFVMACEAPSLLDDEEVADKVHEYVESEDAGCLDGMFDDWKKWGDEKWSAFDSLLSKKDQRVIGILRCCFDVLQMGADDDDGSYEAAMDFISSACRRNHLWATIAEDYELIHVVARVPELLHNQEVIARIVKWCDECDESDGYYTDDDLCCDDAGGTLNRWACVLTMCPQLESHCTTFQKFNGYSRCMLLAKQPQFADRFSLEELGDPQGRCWSTCTRDYAVAWNKLSKAQPQFAKYRKG